MARGYCVGQRTSKGQTLITGKQLSYNQLQKQNKHTFVSHLERNDIEVYLMSRNIQVQMGFSSNRFIASPFLSHLGQLIPATSPALLSEPRKGGTTHRRLSSGAKGQLCLLHLLRTEIFFSNCGTPPLPRCCNSV